MQKTKKADNDAEIIEKVTKKATTTKNNTKKEKTTKELTPKKTTKKVEKETSPKKVTKKAEKETAKKIKKETTPKKAIKKVEKESSPKKVTKKAAKETAKEIEKETTPKKATKKVIKETTPKKITKKAEKETTKKTKKEVSAKKATKEKAKKSLIVSEHYDLPRSYQTTFVSLLAQTPKVLFAFWEISEKDKNDLIEKFGSNFFNNTYPVLIVSNKTKKQTFEIPINDFTSSWYIQVEDSNCEFEIQLGRRPSFGSDIKDFIFVANSNSMKLPNDHILLETLPDSFDFLNLKTKQITHKKLINVSSFENIYNIYNFYKEIYKDELPNNPSSK